MASPKNQQYFKKAKDMFPGGVNSPVRTFRAVSTPPIAVSKGKGPYIWDMDGKQYTDYLQSWGALIVGHAHPAVTRAIHEAAGRGTSYGLSSRPE